jgi:predicted membrane-bound spermidine synthase
LRTSARRRLLPSLHRLGFAGLIYESIWSHYLKLFLGHAAYAQTLVLAIFMGGMALGSWLVSRFTQRIRNLLLGYAIAEGAIGLMALLFHRVFVAATGMVVRYGVARPWRRGRRRLLQVVASPRP